VKLYPRELRSELPARGDDPLRLRVAKGRKIGIGVGKGQNRAVWHIIRPRLPREGMKVGRRPPQQRLHVTLAADSATYLASADDNCATPLDTATFSSPILRGLGAP
jgi:hypothetical protein